MVGETCQGRLHNPLEGAALIPEQASGERSRSSDCVTSGSDLRVAFVSDSLGQQGIGYSSGAVSEGIA
jgi:hypothetical protein